MSVTPPGQSANQPSLTLEQAVEVHGRGDLAAAERGYRNLIRQRRQAPAEAFINLAIICQDDGRFGEATSLWRKLIKLQPGNSQFQLYLAASLKASGKLEQAVRCYRKVLEQQPQLLAAHYNLGNLLQQLGQHQAAIDCYERSLALDPELALALYNMGNSLRKLGAQGRAISAYRRALSLQPNYPDAHNNLGNALRDKGELAVAVESYLRAIALAPDYPQAHYNVGNALFEMGQFAEAIPYFDRAGGRDSRARSLFCCYRTEQFESFAQRLPEFTGAANTSPLVAALAGHYASNFALPNPYNFCPDPLGFVYHQRIDTLAESVSPQREQLLAALAQTGIEERAQGRLHHGSQSSGNLFQRSEAPLQQLAQELRRHLHCYHEQFSGASCELIRQFPQQLDFEGAWYVRMRSGGYLSSHIHETGWISGVVYLQLPPRAPGSDEGNLELSLHGDNYPRRRDDFPSRILQLSVGDIVLFPSSVFHRTLPFSAQQERICVAFDLSPARVSKAGVRP